MDKEKKQILDTGQIRQKIKRMAYEIYEQNYGVRELLIAGIDDMGLRLSELIAGELQKICNIHVHLVRIDIDKKATSQPQVAFFPANSLGADIPELSDFTMILVDDVLNSGKTMIHAMDPFLKMNVRKIQTAVLVNRSHKRFPIAVDYKGLELATTMQEHIEVQFISGEYQAYLY